MRNLRSVLFVIAFASALCGIAAADDLAVVVNKANPIDGLTSAQLKKMVLGQQTTWSSGKKVSVVLRSAGQPERDAVLKSVCGMSEGDYTQFTMHADLNGETLGEPKSLSSAAAVRQSVVGSPGAIGFLKLSDVNDTVKSIPVDGTVAGQPGYRLKSTK